MISKKHGRRSSAELMTPRVLELHPRVQPPPELTVEEAGLFTSIVNTEAAAWFTQANLPLLTQYCRHAVAARRVADLLKTCDETDLDTFGKLLAQQRGESAVLAALCVKLRLAPSSARKDRGAPRLGGPAPWMPHEIK